MNKWEQQYRDFQNKRKPKKGVWNWVKYLVSTPFVWLWYNIRDIRTLIIFIIVLLVVSSEVWVFYLLGLITNNAWFYGIASACWLFWLGPGTPFLVICISLTMAIKMLLNKLKK